MGIKKPIGKGAGKLKEEKLGQGGMFVYMLGIFCLFSVVLLRSFLRNKRKHCRVCGREDISGYYRRGFGEGVRVCMCVCVQGGGCKDPEFKDANREKEETLKKIFFYKNFTICMYSTGFPASKVRFTPFSNKTLI